MENIQNRQRVSFEELGLYLRTIELEYKPKDNQERADLITEFFNVICLVEDIENYESLWHKYTEEKSQQKEERCEFDYELESRRAEYFAKIGAKNPY
jgi:hypothetical protein